MVKQGDIVQFHAVVEGWGLFDWEVSGADEEYIELLEHLDGEIAVVTGIAVDSFGEPVFVDLNFDGIYNLYAISTVHIAPAQNVIPFPRKAG